MPIHYKTGNLHETFVTDQELSSALCVENTLAQWYALIGTQQGLLALRTNRPCCLAGATHVIFEPLDFMYRMYGMPRAQGCAGAAISRLVSLIPKPRVNLTRFHGVFAPNSKHRVLVTPAKRGRGKKIKTPDDAQDQTPAEKRASMTWAQRLKRVFDIDIETCSECGGEVRIIASIEDPEVIRKILAHLDEKVTPTGTGMLPKSRAPPATGLFV